MVPLRTVSFKCRLMHVHPRAYVCIIIEKTKKANSLEDITWSELGKQNIQAKKVYWFASPLQFSLVGGDIRTLLGEIDILEDVTGLLDLEERYWRSFALKFHKFSVSVLDSLRPEPISSPTKMVLNCIVQENPQLTMRSFLLTLEKMERRDLILELKEFFKRKILRISLRIVPE